MRLNALKKFWILSLILNITAAVIWTTLGRFDLMCMYLFVALFTIYFIIKGQNK